MQSDVGAEAAGTELEGEQRAAMAQVEATQEPPSGYAPVANDQTLVVEADGVMARYRDRHLDGTLIKGEWHEIKLGLAGGWQDDHLVSPHLRGRTRNGQRVCATAGHRG